MAYQLTAIEKEKPMAERKRGLNEISYTNPVKEKAANQ
jgi:hypothetical protein